MSANLTLRVRLFGQVTDVPLAQTPTEVTHACLALGSNSERAKFYASWLRSNRPGWADDEDHLRQVALYGEHLLASWSFR